MIQKFIIVVLTLAACLSALLLVLSCFRQINWVGYVPIPTHHWVALAVFDGKFSILSQFAVDSQEPSDFVAPTQRDADEAMDAVRYRQEANAEGVDLLELVRQRKGPRWTRDRLERALAIARELPNAGMNLAPWLSFSLAGIRVHHERNWEAMGQRQRWTSYDTELVVPLWIPLVLFSVYPLTCRPLRKYIRRKRGLCIRCGYDLTGNVSGVCPECGTEIETK